LPRGLSQNKAPAYPAEARRKRYEGTVMLFVEVNEDGSVGRASIEASSGYEILDRAALDAVKQWKFTPAQQDGRSVRSEGRVPIEFVLHG
jgi:protein TonB